MKKDGKGEDLTFEKVVDLYEGLSIWKVNIERCREQDTNARVMDKETFDRLTANIAEDSRLESLPFGYIEANPSGNMEFKIISGHHRIRAARSANVVDIFVLVHEGTLTRDQVISKQLSHNALSGEDDTQTLKKLYDEIEDIDEKIKSGIREVDLDTEQYRMVSVEDVALDFDFKTLKLFFLNKQMKDFEAVCDQIQSDDKVAVSTLEEFDQISETIRKVSKNENIRNVSSIIARMCEIVSAHYFSIEEALEANGEEEGNTAE